MPGVNKKLVLKNSGPFVLEESEIPAPPPGGLIVKVKYAGICHSDCVVKADCEEPRNSSRLPYVMGHEIAGVVHSLGDNCQNSTLNIGDRVVVFVWAGCLNCALCRTDPTLCRKKLSPENHFYGLGLDGGYQEYCLVHSSNLVVKLPESISLDLGSLLGCSGLTTYNAVSTVKPNIDILASHQESTSLLIVGAGGLGLWTLALAKAMLPSNTRIVVADISEDKLKLAKEKGADATVLWSREDDPQEQISRTRAALNGGADASIDLVNMTATVGTVFGSVNSGAVMVLIGLYKGPMPQLPLNIIPLMNITIKGLLTGNQTMLQELVDLVAEKNINPLPINYVELKDVDDVIERLNKGQVEGRAIVKLED